MFKFDSMTYKEYLEFIKAITNPETFFSNIDTYLSKYSDYEDEDIEEMSVEDVMQMIQEFTKAFQNWVNEFLGEYKPKSNEKLGWNWKQLKKYNEKLRNNESVAEFLGHTDNDLASEVLKSQNRARILLERSLEAKN